MQPDIIYQGKQLDSTSAVLIMAMETVGMTEMPYSSCLTTRPFSLQCPLNTPSMWFAPFLTPLDGLISALDVLGLHQEYQLAKLSSLKQAPKHLFAILEQWLQNGPVIVGPLDRTQIWDRIEARYYKGAAYFILVLEKGENERLWVHDPEGCPYHLIPQDRILSALENANFQSGILQIRSASEARSRDEIFRHTFLAGAKTRAVAATHPEGNGCGIRSLAQELTSRKLKASEEGALNFAIPSLGLALKQIAEFITDMPETIGGNFPHWEKTIPQLLAALTEYGVDCAYALEALKKRNQIELCEQFFKMVHNEDLLDKLFAYVVEGITS